MTTNDSPELTHFFSSNPHYGTPDAITAEGCVALAEDESPLWHEWRKKYPVNFENYTFSEDVCFQQIDFGDDASFAGATFEGTVTFKYCRFGKNANFTKTIFEGDTLFERVDF